MLLVVCRASWPSIMVWGLISLQPERALRLACHMPSTGSQTTGLSPTPEAVHYQRPRVVALL